MAETWECPDCGTTVVGRPELAQKAHNCLAKWRRLARVFEPADDEQPEWIEQASPSEELRTRVEDSIQGTGIEVEYVVKYDATGSSGAIGRIVRRVHVVDPGLPEPHTRQVRELDHQEEWNDVLCELGLIAR